MNAKDQRSDVSTWWRQRLGLGLAALMIGSLFQAVSFPSAAASSDEETVTEQPVDGSDGIPVIERPTGGAPRVPGEAPRAAWPEPGPVDVRLSADDSDTALPTRAGDLPIWLQADAGPAPLLRRQDVTAEVTVMDREATEAAGVDGAVFTVAQQSTHGGQRPADQLLDVRLDYGSFAEAYGGGYGARLTLHQLPTCALETPDEPECRERVPLETVNDTEQQTLRARAVALDASQPLVLAAAADEAGIGSDYSATPLSASGTWGVGLNTGDFQWSYPIQIPDVPGGLVPEVGISYSSGAIDGRTGNTNNQASWTGDGFDLWPGYIERQYQSCAEEGFENPDGDVVGDLCWEYDNAFISFNGHADELVPVGDGEWKFQQDDGTRIRRLTSTSRANGDNDNEYWELTSPDGTRYYFGYHRLPGWTNGNETTDSVWTVPVFGNDDGEECHASTPAASWCHQAWRWNLDYVVDPLGNTMAYYYDTEANHYGRFLDPEAGTRYIRGGTIDRIDYGLRDTGNLYNQQPLATVDFTSGPRCLPQAGVNCDASAIDANEPYWYDTPWDLNCASDAQCDDGRFSPSFWTRNRLTGIATSIWQDGADQDVDSWALNHRWGQADVDYQLLLESIQRTGHTGPDTAQTVTLPRTSFTYAQLANRLDRIGDGYAPFIKERLATITDEVGGQISVGYSDPDCSFDALPTPQNNTTRCFPQYIGGSHNEDPDLEWFNKYVVASVTALDRTGGAPNQVTRYQYLGGAAWHYDDDNGLVPASEKTWSQWRGYGHVRVQTGGQGDDGMISQEDTYFLRGMHGDRRDPSGGTKSVTVPLPDGEGDPITDYAAYQGFAYRTATYDGVDGPVLTKSVSRPWHHETARDERSWGDITANFIGTSRVSAWTSLDDGAGVRWRSTRVDTTHDTVAGRPTQVNDLGDTSTTADDRCTRTTYASGSILTLTSREETVAVNCTATANRAEDVISDVRYAYDGRDYGQNPTAGSVTRTATIEDHDGTTARYLESSATYDSYGRGLTVTDLTASIAVTGSSLTRTTRGDGRTTTTTYSPTSGFATQITETTPPANPTAPSTAQTTTTRLDVRRGVPTALTDTNGRVTNILNDAFGRTWRVWLPNRETTWPPTYEFTYRIAEGQPVAVTTHTLDTNGAQRLSDITLYDGFLRARQVQSPGPDNGRLVADTFYDARGLVARTFATYYTTGSPQQSVFEADDLMVESQTWHTYDALGRETELRQVAGKSDGAEVLNTTRTSYHGDRTTVIPPTGATATTTLIDARGQTTELRQHHQRSSTADYDSTRYTYTPAGHLETLTDPAGNRWTYTYDLRGRTEETTDPDAGRTTMTYNDRGELTTRTNARGTTLAYVYDNLGRQTQLRENSTTGRLRAEWVYDTVSRAEGQLARSIRYGDENQAYVNEVQAYDTLYRPTRTRLVIPSSEGDLAGIYPTTTTYNGAGLVMGVSVPAVGGLPEGGPTYRYDDRTLWLSNTFNVRYDSKVSYTLSGKPEQYTLSQGVGSPATHVVNTYEWGTQRLATSQVLRQDIPGFDRAAAYSYDEAGNVLSIADTSRSGTDTQCFQYDYLQRMTEAWSQPTEDCTATPSESIVGGPAPYWNSYTYDLSGNRRTETLHEQDTSRTYDYPEPGTPQPHTVTSVTENASGTTSLEEYEYDLAGNTTRRQTSDDTQQLTWDPEGRLASVEEADGSVTSYLYDADGNRLISRTPTETTLYTGITEITLETNATDVHATRYIDLGGGNVAVEESDGDLYFTASDHHGTGQLAIDAETLDITQRRTLPFGGPRGEAPSTWPGSRGFVGGITDDTGLTHLGAREYDPRLGRFISLDPVMDLTDPQQVHGYAYASNSPVTLSDPTGLIQDGCWIYGCTFDGRGKAKGIHKPKGQAPTTSSSRPAPSFNPRSMILGGAGASTGPATSTPRPWLRTFTEAPPIPPTMSTEITRKYFADAHRSKCMNNSIALECNPEDAIRTGDGPGLFALAAGGWATGLSAPARTFGEDSQIAELVGMSDSAAVARVQAVENYLSGGDQTAYARVISEQSSLGRIGTFLNDGKAMLSYLFGGVSADTAEAVLGSFNIEWEVLRANEVGIQVRFTAVNTLSASSFAHIFTGYGNWAERLVHNTLDSGGAARFGTSWGPGRDVRMEVHWRSVIYFNDHAAPPS